MEHYFDEILQYFRISTIVFNNFGQCWINDLFKQSQFNKELGKVTYHMVTKDASFNTQFFRKKRANIGSKKNMRVPNFGNYVELQWIEGKEHLSEKQKLNKKFWLHG